MVAAWLESTMAGEGEAGAEENTDVPSSGTESALLAAETLALAMFQVHGGGGEYGGVG